MPTFSFFGNTSPAPFAAAIEQAGGIVTRVYDTRDGWRNLRFTGDDALLTLAERYPAERSNFCIVDYDVAEQQPDEVTCDIILERVDVDRAALRARQHGSLLDTVP